MSAEITPEHRIRAELNMLIEPNDLAGGALLSLIEPAQCLAMITSGYPPPADLQRRCNDLLGLSSTAADTHSLPVALQRWRKRISPGRSDKLLEALRRNGGGLLIPGDPLWPTQLGDLQLGQPICLWWRAKQVQRVVQCTLDRCVSIVGSRDCSDYGQRVTQDFAEHLYLAGNTIVSGGAYGVDATAHRAALNAAAVDEKNLPTIAILAGGIDRLYPSGNSSLLTQVIHSGIILSEVPPGTPPARFRFLNRNRLIAALSRVTLVTEARYRSGALNTVGHALDLGRDVAAVPGSVYSAYSAGTHRLISEGQAQLVSEPRELLGESVLPGTGGTIRRLTDALTLTQRMVYDSLEVCRALPVSEIAARAGISDGHAMTALRYLGGQSLARQQGTQWCLAPQEHGPKG